MDVKVSQAEKTNRRTEIITVETRFYVIRGTGDKNVLCGKTYNRCLQI